MHYRYIPTIILGVLQCHFNLARFFYYVSTFSFIPLSLSIFFHFDSTFTFSNALQCTRIPHLLTSQFHFHSSFTFVQISLSHNCHFHLSARQHLIGCSRPCQILSFRFHFHFHCTIVHFLFNFYSTFTFIWLTFLLQGHQARQHLIGCSGSCQVVRFWALYRPEKVTQVG